MHELRKDILLGRWVVVLRESKGPDYYYIPPSSEEGACLFCQESFFQKDILTLGDPGRWKVKVVPNPEPVLRVEGDLGRRGIGIYDAMNSIGANEIIIESPYHDKTPEELGTEHLRAVIEAYRLRIEDLHRDARLRYVLIYKNHGRLAGAHYNHPHSSLMATPIIPKRLKEELDGAKQYYGYKERCIFCDIMHEELSKGVRVVLETSHMIAYCPFAPRFPFEVWLMPKRHNCAFQESSSQELDDLSHVLYEILRKMKALFGDLPYNYVLHTAPNRIPRRNHWHTLGDDFHWHIEFMPRLQRTGGFEWGSGFYILQTSPEDAAKFLREV
ncbi:MAG: galactose-1-phosphate uridylyltransferase [Thermodesulfovibrionales bacterium]|nr:galactose-1-phosphate uridylyltransferase [Thermodesulfovibrionales bacterium]